MGERHDMAGTPDPQDTTGDTIDDALRCCGERLTAPEPASGGRIGAHCERCGRRVWVYAVPDQAGGFDLLLDER